MLKWIGFHWLVHYTKSRNVVWNPRVSSLFIVILLWLSLFHTLIFLPKRGKIFATCFFFFPPTRITCSGVHLKKKSKPQVLFRSAPLSYPIHKRPVYRVNAWNMSLELRNTANCMFWRQFKQKKTMSSFVSPTIALLNKLYRWGRLHLDLFSFCVLIDLNSPSRGQSFLWPLGEDFLGEGGYMVFRGNGGGISRR